MMMSWKACIRGRFRLRHTPLLYTYRDCSHDMLSSSIAAMASAPLPDLSRSADAGFGFRFSSYLHPASSRLHIPVSRLMAPSAQCSFSTEGGSDEQEELSVDNDGTEGISEDEDGGELDFMSEPQTSLPKFTDPVEEAAYIGYRVVGRVKTGDFGSDRAPRAFAVVQVGSHQFKISPGDCIYTEKLKFADVNDKLSLEKVLLLGSKSQTIIGRPFVPKAFVHAAVEEQVLDAKVIIFKKKRRKNYRRCNGHRQELTRLRILEIWGLGQARPTFVASCS